MGHTVDPMFYNKIWQLDQDYNLAQFHIAEKHLNILSYNHNESTESLLERLQNKMAELGYELVKREHPLKMRNRTHPRT